jgi:hypothetical protein
MPAKRKINCSTLPARSHTTACQIVETAGKASEEDEHRETQVRPRAETIRTCRFGVQPSRTGLPFQPSDDRQACQNERFLGLF